MGECPRSTACVRSAPVPALGGFQPALAPLLLVALALGGCGRTARLVDPHTEVHLSGNWNDADSRDTAAVIIPQCLQAPWIEDFQRAHGRAPVVRIGHVRVRVQDLDDQIDPDIVTDDLQRALIASGRVRAVASRGEAAVQRAERGDLAANAAQAPAARAELAADYLLGGSIFSQNDAVLDPGVVSGTYRRVKFYQVTLTLIDLTSNELVWSGGAERKKTTEQSTLGW